MSRSHQQSQILLNIVHVQKNVYNVIFTEYNRETEHFYKMNSFQRMLRYVRATDLDSSVNVIWTDYTPISRFSKEKAMSVFHLSFLQINLRLNYILKRFAYL